MNSVRISDLSREMLEKAAETYDKAHDLILERGWWKAKTDADRTSKMLCIEAACGYAWTGHPYYMGGRVLVPKSLPVIIMDLPIMQVDDWFVNLTRSRFGMWAGWNDAEITTVDDVYDRLRHAAKVCREEAGKREPA